MHYRVAIQVDQPPRWQWKSTLLSELSALFQWLRLYRALPQDQLRVFSSSSREELNELLARENKGGASGSTTAAQFLQQRRITPQGAVREASTTGIRENERTASMVALREPSQGESSKSPLDKRREELERGAGGDHDLPYRFTLPTSMPQVLAWLKLQVRVQQGDLRL